MLVSLVDFQTTFHPETIDSITDSKYEYVIVSGVASFLGINGDGLLELRIVNKNNHSLTCILPRNFPQPKLGIEVIVSGKRVEYKLIDRVHIELLVYKLEPSE